MIGKLVLYIDIYLNNYIKYTPNQDKNVVEESDFVSLVNAETFGYIKEERYTRVPRLSDTRYSAKGTKGKWRYASSKASSKCATYRR